MKWEPNLKTTREPWNCGNASRRDGFVAHRLVPLCGKHGDSVNVTACWINTHHNRIYPLRMKVIIFSNEKHFCPNQTHHPPCHTSSGVHWALLDIGALSGGPWIFQVKFYQGLRKNIKVSGSQKIVPGKTQKCQSFKMKYQFCGIWRHFHRNLSHFLLCSALFLLFFWKFLSFLVIFCNFLKKKCLVKQLVPRFPAVRIQLFLRPDFTKANIIKVHQKVLAPLLGDSWQRSWHLWLALELVAGAH